jgi:hypothetical protein
MLSTNDLNRAHCQYNDAVAHLSTFLLVAEGLPELPVEESEDMAFVRLRNLEAKYENDDDEDIAAIHADAACQQKLKVGILIFA